MLAKQKLAMLTIVVEEWLMVNMLEKGVQREKIKQQNKFTPSTVIRIGKTKLGRGWGMPHGEVILRVRSPGLCPQFCHDSL